VKATRQGQNVLTKLPWWASESHCRPSDVSAVLVLGAVINQTLANSTVMQCRRHGLEFIPRRLSGTGRQGNRNFIGNVAGWAAIVAHD